MKATIGSSIICMDHANFEQHTSLAAEIGINYLHVDVMDGNYVPRYGIYPEIIKSLSNVTPMKMDLHLMVSNPGFALSQFAGIDNIEYISVHLDGNQNNLLIIFDKIIELGCKPVLVIDLGSDIDHIAQYISNDLVSGIMFMGIHPGVLKQTARPNVVIQKLNELKKLCDISTLFVQCDGGVTFETIPKLFKAGINNFVCGSSTLYKNCDYTKPYGVVADQIKSNYKILSNFLND